MKLLCYVDQTECIRRGINAPSSTVKIEVDPALLTPTAREFVASNTDEKLRFPSAVKGTSDAGRQLGGICPPTYRGFLEYIQHRIQGKVIDSRAAMKQAWEQLAKSILYGIGYATDPSAFNPDGFTPALVQIENDKLLAQDLVRSVYSLQQTARKVFNFSEFGYDPSEEVARNFITNCSSLTAIVFEAINPPAVPPAYPVSDEVFSRLNKRRMSFENVRIGNSVLTGKGTLDIQRHAGHARADIVINQWFGTQGTTRRIFLGERAFRKIEDLGEELFLDGRKF